MFAFCMSSGLFLGWSLGANDASNVFGTAVGSKMVNFRTAAIYCSIFLILGAVISGAGATHTLGKLGSVNAIAGAFIVDLSAGMNVYLMTKARNPVSTSQAIVGAVIGVGLLKGGRGIRWRTLGGITSSWVVAPVIAAIISFISLFFLQNVFEQEVYQSVKYRPESQAVVKIKRLQISLKILQQLFIKKFAIARRSNELLARKEMLSDQDRIFFLNSTKRKNDKKHNINPAKSIK